MKTVSTGRIPAFLALLLGLSVASSVRAQLTPVEQLFEEHGIAFSINETNEQYEIVFDADDTVYYVLSSSVDLIRFVPHQLAAPENGRARFAQSRAALVDRLFFSLRAIPIDEPQDLDDDGIDDFYELQNGLNPLDPTDALVIPEGATQTRLESYRAYLAANAPETAETEPDLIEHDDSHIMRAHGGPALALVPPAHAGFASAQSGAWSDPDTWVGGSVPGADAKVRIAAGHTFRFDVVQAERMLWVRVDGRLLFDHTVNTRLLVETLVVTDTGVLTVGTEENPIGPDVVARIVIADAGADFDNRVDVHEIGRGVVSLGRVAMHGATVTPYVSLAVEPLAGATQLVLDAEPQNWVVGDRLVLTGSGRLQDETLFITGIGMNGNGQTVLAIDRDPEADGIQGLANNHTTPGYGLKMFVANMNRHIAVASENPAVLDRRGHVMFMHNLNADVRNVAFVGLGRSDKRRRADDPHLNEHGQLVAGTNPRGRYAVHFHEGGTAAELTPGVVTGCVVDTSPGWGYVNHSSHARIDHNVAYDVVGASFVMEIGNERGTFDGNLSIRNTGSGGHVTDGRGVFDFGHTGNAFWMEGSGVSLRNNISTGARRYAIFYSKNRSPITNFENNMVYGTSTAISMWKQLNNIVFDGLTSWTFDDAIQFPYARRITVRNSTLIGNPANPRGKAIDALVEQYYTEFDNNTIVGWETGLAPLGQGTVIIRDGYYANVKNIIILPAGTPQGRTFQILGNPQFETLTAAQLNGREQRNYDLWPGVGGGGIDIEKNFSALQARVLYNDDQQIYWPQQASDYVAYRSGVNPETGYAWSPTWIPQELLDKTNQQLLDEFGLIPGGSIAPANATPIPFSNGLLGARVTYLPAIHLRSAKWARNLDNYILSYTTPSGQTVTETTPLRLREGWNVLTRVVEGVSRSFLVYGDITPPTIWVGPVPPTVHYEQRHLGKKVKTLLSDDSFGPRRLTVRFGDLSGHPLHIDHAGRVYLVATARGTDFAGNVGPLDIKIVVLGAPLLKRVKWYRNEFFEDPEVPGKIANNILVEAYLDSFTADAADHIDINNVPAGLTPNFRRLNDTQIVVEFLGRAANHEPEDTIGDLSIRFGDAAFTSGRTDEMADAIRPAIPMTFYEDSPPWVTWDGQSWFNEAAVNDGTVEQTKLVTVHGGDAFAEDAADHITLSGELPAGLTPHFERVSATQMRMSWTGAATAHGENDWKGFSVHFQDGAFIGNSAFNVDGAPVKQLWVIFED